ncbi:MAG TPA: hypothetical protein VK509_10645 [Polyangiales bacterium]|nr:hypothetical protein [Polyangiales bacterium]
MAKWVKVGGVLLALAWTPFLYAELSSEGPEQRERDLPSDAAHDDNAELQPLADSEHEATGGRAAAVPTAVAAEEPHPAEPAAEPAAEDLPPAAAAPVVPAAAPSAAEHVEQLAAATAVPAAQPGVQPPTAAPAEHAEHAEHAEEVVAEGEEPEPEPTPPTSSGPAEALKQAYDQQPRDPLWAADLEAKLGALFGNEDVPSDLLRSASCRKAVCRVELRWTSARATAYVSAYEAIQKLLGGEVGVEPVGAPSEQGEQQVNLYLTRKGYTLADLSR